MKEYKILSVKDGELPMCLETVRSAFEIKARQFGYTKENYPTCGAFVTLDQLREAKARRVHMYAAWVGDRIAGYVQLEKKREGVYSFQRFSVLPEYQNLGIGKALISHCKQRAASYGAEKLTLLMRYENRPLFDFYRHCGFVLKNLGRDDAHPFEFAIMELDIAKRPSKAEAELMPKYKNCLFDLDGTLTDPGLGIKNSIRYALREFGLEPLTEETLDAFIGPPLLDSFEKYCKVSKSDAEELLRLYRVYFSDKGLFENSVYEGVRETLETLSKMGVSICLATSKPEPYAVRILEHFNLLKYFRFVGGSLLDNSRVRKTEVINYVLKSADIRAGETVMIGDRKYDVEGAHACGIDCAGVLYGYGSEEELSDAEYIVAEPGDIECIF